MAAVDGHNLSQISAAAVLRHYPIVMLAFRLSPYIACTHLSCLSMQLSFYFARSKVLLAIKSNQADGKITVRREGGLLTTAGRATPAPQNARTVSAWDAQLFYLEVRRRERFQNEN